MDRRNFLKGSVLAGTAGIALDACAPGSDQLIPLLVPEEPFVPGEETFAASACFECHAGCGILVRKIDGRLVKVEGNPAHPESRGGVCARGQALPQAMYHPDRIQTPLLREGEGFREATWEEALERVAATLASGDVGFVTGETRGQRRAMVERFLGSFPSSRLFVHEPYPTSTLGRANRLTTGRSSLFGCDIANADYVISFGAEILESHVSPVGFASGLSDMRGGRAGRRGKFVMVGPRLSLTAANADEWIPVRPETELELALALLFVLLSEGRYDESLARGASGFEEFRSLVLERGESAGERTGIPRKRIERLARELSEHRPAVALAGGAAVRSPRGLALALGVSHLNALLGAYGEEGLLTVGDEARSEPVDALAAALRRGDDLPRVLFVSDANPAYSLPPALGFAERAKEVELLVSFSSFPDETTALADVVLPESMSFERFEEALPTTSGASFVALATPLLVRPLYDTRSMPDALIELAKRAGAPFPWGSYESALREAWSSHGPSWDEAVASGGFFPTEQRRPVTSRLEYRFALDGLSAESPSTPLSLHVYASNAFGDGRSAHLPYLQELSDPVTGVRWGTVVEIAAATAKAREIRSGDVVEVRSGDRTLTAPAFVSEGIHPAAVAIAAGQGHEAYGRYAAGRGVNAYTLFDGSVDEDGFIMSAPDLELRKVNG
jgi:anaerobic selenocysteine-containing dehydrogenase